MLGLKPQGSRKSYYRTFWKLGVYGDFGPLVVGPELCDGELVVVLLLGSYNISKRGTFLFRHTPGPVKLVPIMESDQKIKPP